MRCPYAASTKTPARPQRPEPWRDGASRWRSGSDWRPRTPAACGRSRRTAHLITRCHWIWSVGEVSRCVCEASEWHIAPLTPMVLPSVVASGKMALPSLMPFWVWAAQTLRFSIGVVTVDASLQRRFRGGRPCGSFNHVGPVQLGMVTVSLRPRSPRRPPLAASGPRHSTAAPQARGVHGLHRDAEGAQGAETVSEARGSPPRSSHGEA